MHKIIFALICCKFLLAGEPPKDSPKVRWKACDAAHDHIRSALKAPKTAEFPNCYRHDELVHTDRLGDQDGGYAVTTYVDAENSFGVKLRGFYMCAVNMPDADHVQTQCLETDADHKKTLRLF